MSEIGGPSGPLFPGQFILPQHAVRERERNVAAAFVFAWLTTGASIPSADRVDMVRELIVIVGFTVTASGLHAQIPSQQREDRVVIYSPHFDAPAPGWGGLSCPAGPLALYGFETETRGQPAELLVRVFGFFGDRRGGNALRAAMVFLTHKLTGDSTTSLPQRNPYIALTDSGGTARFSAAAGVYRIKFQRLGYLGGEGIIRIRENARDSLHAYLDRAAIC